MPLLSTEDVAKGRNDRPTEDVVIADCGEVRTVYRNPEIILTGNSSSSPSNLQLTLMAKRCPFVLTSNAGDILIDVLLFILLYDESK